MGVEKTNDTIAEKAAAAKVTTGEKTVEKKPVTKKTATKKTAPKKASAKTVTAEIDAVEEAAVEEPAQVQAHESPRRSIAFIGSECYPFVKTGGLGDVMYALPKALIRRNCDVKVILPRYKCIPQKYQEKMVYRGSFYMDLTSDGRQYYVGIMEYVWDGVVYDFIDNGNSLEGISRTQT